jgi:hypothetical protein
MIGLLMSMEQTVESELARETEILGENPSQCHFCTTNPTRALLQSIALIMISESTQFEAPRYVIVSNRLLVPLAQLLS